MAPAANALATCVGEGKMKGRVAIVWALAFVTGCCVLTLLLWWPFGVRGSHPSPPREYKAPVPLNPPMLYHPTPLPKEPSFEAGPSDAKVRIIAFYPIDAQHQQLIDLLKGLVGQYSGRVYLKYIDYRTPEGMAAYQDAKVPGPGLLINGKREIIVRTQLGPQTVDFSNDLGLFWTAGDLRGAVAQEVAAAYAKNTPGT